MTAWPKGIKKQVGSVIKNEQLYKDAILPLEEIIHDFAIEALKAFESTIVLDKNEPESIRQRIKDARKKIEASEDEKQISVLNKQLRK